MRPLLRLLRLPLQPLHPTSSAIAAMNALLSSPPGHGNVLFGLLAALFWGGGDFSGGMSSKHAGGKIGAALRVILLSHCTSFVVLATVAIVRGDPFPHGAPLAWGLFTGMVGGLSVACFYMALARGEMGIAAAVSGLLAAAVPASVSLYTEGSPGTLHLLGFLIVGIAIWLIAAAPSGVLEHGEAPTTLTILMAVVAGAGFGLYFIALKQAGVAGVAWPMATARIGSLCTCSLLLAAMSITKKTEAETTGRPRFGMTRSTVLWALAAALLDTCGNLFFLSATRAGRLDIAAVLASLYPASTILLAASILKERFSLRQGLGMAIAGVAVVLITL